MSTGGVLRYTIVVRHPDTAAATALLAGKPVPEWASGLVHADDLEGGASSAPAGNASRDEWTAFATSKGAPESETGEDGLSRNDLREKYGY